jgi:hypothetical protein
MDALAATPEPEGAREGADSLLDMFSAVGIKSEDRTLLLELAGNVEIDDLISELGLVAAALGIVQGQREEASGGASEEPLAA